MLRSLNTQSARTLAGAGRARLAVRVRTLCSDSDFSPQRKAFAADGDVRAQIQAEIDSNKVVVFMKGVPDSPMCGFSNTVVQVPPRPPPQPPPPLLRCRPLAGSPRRGCRVQGRQRAC